MTDTPTLRGSDAVNLADDRMPCPNCSVVRIALDKIPEYVEVTHCDYCNGRGTIVADTGREALSHTRLSAKLRCSRLFELSYREALEPIETPVPLEVGRAFAHALQHNDPIAGSAFLMDHAVIGSPEDDDKAVTNAAIVHAGARYYLDRWPRTNARVADVLADELAHPERADTHPQHYGPYGRAGERLGMLASDVAAAEDGMTREFEYRVRLRSPYTGAPSLTFDLTGRIDALVDKGDHWLMVEDKFMGQITPLTLKRLKLDRQISLGCYGVWRATGKPVREILYRIVRKPSIKQKQSETLDEYVVRLHADYTERPDFYGYEETLYRSDDDLLTIEQELWTWAEEIRQADRQRIFPRNTSACLDFGGCRFLPICAGDPDALSLYQRKGAR